MAYWEKLEDKWRQNRVSQEDIGTLPRPKDFRGKTFFTELARLYTVTRDPRFNDAMTAMFENGIINARLNYVTRPETFNEKNLLVWIGTVLIHKIETDKIIKRRACAEVAAIIGHPANSFVAAVKDMEILYKDLSRPGRLDELKNDINNASKNME